MEKKNCLQDHVKKAVYNIADYILSKSQNCMYAGRAKAIGFTNEVKRFKKAELEKRKDGELYY